MLDAVKSAASEPVAWSGQGRYRLLVELPSIDLEQREQDEMPAEIEADFTEALATLGEAGTVDVASVQVIRYDKTSGKPIARGSFAYGKSDADRPYRWYDGSVPYEFPEFAGDVSRTDGKLPRTPTLRGGYFYNAIGDWKQGRLAWLHTQEGATVSSYAIYFDLLPEGDKPNRVPPRGWIGDGLARCDKRGGSTMGADHCRIDLDDWNGDGLTDIIAGEQYGHLFVWPNRGTKADPAFPYCRFLFDDEGVPIDVGSSSAPKVVDWNGDGAQDLLVGAEWNRILLFLNQGTNTDRRLKYVGLLEADGETLMLPIRPLERGSEKIFKRDYYPILETADWDDDGDLDLLAGGYVTGRVFFYENTETDADGLPQLMLRGAIEADGKPLNVGHWCAAPCAADFDGDGDLDLISGNMPVSEKGGDAEGTEAFLRYYENVGNRRSPRLVERDFPAAGQFPSARLATPRAADWDDDGDLDLIVSARENVYLFANQGDATRSDFAAHRRSLPGVWGGARIPAGQFLDWNDDGKLDLFVRSHYSIRLNSGRGNPWFWEEEVAVLPPGEHIAHPSGIGDDWFWPYLDDFDQDGRIDILFGDWSGHIWFHRNLATGDATEADALQFDRDGAKLPLVNGELLKVGPIGKDLDSDFSALQGARTTFTTADFDRDGKRDLVVGDTYGKVRYFRRGDTAGEIAFDAPIEIGNLGIRLLVDATDWNGDGWDDVIAGAANGRVRVFLNTGPSGATRFADGFDPGLPTIAQPRVLMADLNGDGDEDLFLPSTQGSCFVERSFLQHGYVRGKILRIERRPE